LDDGLDSGESGVLDRGSLVGESLEEGRERRAGGVGNDVWLEELGSAVLTEGRDDGGTGLTDLGRLLVGKGLYALAGSIF